MNRRAFIGGTLGGAAGGAHSALSRVSPNNALAATVAGRRATASAVDST